MRKIEEKIRKILLILGWSLAGTFLGVMTFSVFLQVVTRYILHISLSWPEELARFCFIWTSLLGAFIAWERNKLHDIDIVFNYFPGAFRPFVAVGSNLLVCVILVWCLKSSMFDIGNLTCRQIAITFIKIRISKSEIPGPDLTCNG